MKIQFLGAARVVTGSCFLLTTEKSKILIDCGLFQGSENLEKLNYEEFQFNPAEIDYLILSHAHIDHSGRIPKLVKEGFEGQIICTKATSDLCEIMLLDSGHIQESDAKWENKKRNRAGKPLVEPLYTAKDASTSLRYFKPILYGQKINLNDEISIRFRDAGHILGSSIVELWIKEKEKTVKVVFSGDLGLPNKPILRDPEYIEEADYLIIESTYGNREHINVENRVERLTKIIDSTVLRGGTVVIPSFAVGRTQELIYELNKYYEYNKNIEAFMRIPIYIDSPMAVSATKIFQENSDCFDAEAKKLILSGDNPFEFQNLHYIRSQEDSMRLNSYDFPKVIISASGMCNAGRIRHHIKYNLWKKSNSIVFVGYQAEGTLGRMLKDGIKSVKLLGDKIAVEAEIHSVEGFSGHTDQKGLIDWMRGFKKLPKNVFIVHGESESSLGLSQAIEKHFNIESVIPAMNSAYELDTDIIDNELIDIVETIKLKDNIKVELQQVYDQFEGLVSKTGKMMDDETLKKDYDSLKNNLIELQKKLMDLNILISE
ncbi:MBL fold metallo-hydrolase [Proteiniborus sp. MB09-C3]|uniref:MBL fold metallo-hydrolase RNA specificity domain-containing protein n=1 Tax=Proteiniborus sp. MB09-C3 TaxID=3050072 RepID=UPI0025525F93|nr:MBL fold metallo-hydrolase [Proteiniborus sp. MB09-C3]WIV11708.1 MBL fold metallo-hydrolase [Proteiniborus sp. MB09-C3]